MELQITLEQEQRTFTHTSQGATVADLLQELTINPETVLVVRSNDVLTEDDTINDKDALEILSVISGG